MTPEHAPDPAPASAPLTADQLRAIAAIRPSERQLRWQELEFTAFVHFGINTATDREWGLGDEDPRLFDPRSLDADQWMRSFVAAGMTGAILTVKHHDGFCLWPSALTDHSVAASPWRDGEGDVLREFADAASRHGVQIGIYLSPWDRHEPSYGSGAAYDDFFVGQLEELLGGEYGDMFSVWFDGANGEGPDGRVQEYDWDRYHATVRRLQPGAAISICGPDVRWCGNEAGRMRPDEWSVVPGLLRDMEKIAERSQRIDDGAFSRLVRSDDDDLGSRAALAGSLHDLVWYPAEVDTSIRPGWFHHASEDSAVRSPDELFDLWASCVGGNAVLLLNVPPRADGLLAEPDVASLEGVGARIRAFRSRVVRAEAAVTSGAVSEAAGGLSAAFATGRAPAWSPSADDELPAVTLRFDGPTSIEAVVLREAIADGQRVERVVVRSLDDGAVLAERGVVGHLRIVRLDPTRVSGLVVEFPEFRAPPALRAVAAVAAR